MNMKTLNEKVAETVKSNNATMGNVEELTKVLKQEEKELERLTKRNADEAVIAAQQNVVDSAKAKLEQAQEFEKESNENIGNDFLTFSVVNEEKGIEYKDMTELLQHPKIVGLFRARIDTLQQQFAHYEQIKRFTLLPEPFSMERGELTNTLKLKRAVVAKNYSEQIEKMYEESEK
jgi:hypothetical protein